MKYKVQAKSEHGSTFEQIFDSFELAQEKINWLKSNQWVNVSMVTIKKSWDELSVDTVNALQNHLDTMQQAWDSIDDEVNIIFGGSKKVKKYNDIH